METRNVKKTECKVEGANWPVRGLGYLRLFCSITPQSLKHFLATIPNFVLFICDEEGVNERNGYSKWIGRAPNTILQTISTTIPQYCACRFGDKDA